MSYCAGVSPFSMRAQCHDKGHCLASRAVHDRPVVINEAAPVALSDGALFRTQLDLSKPAGF